MHDFLQYFVNGLILGGIIGLTAIGLSLVYGILNLANFAHGDYITLGAYLAFFFTFNMELGILPAFFAALAISSLFAVLIDRIVWRSLRERKATLITLLITSIGVAFVLRNIIILLWGNSLRTYGLKVEEGLNFFGVRITPIQIGIILSAVLIMFLIHLLLHYTKLGKAMRAASDNLDLAEVSGIDVERIITWTWVIAAALAAVGGIMLGLHSWGYGHRIESRVQRCHTAGTL